LNSARILSSDIGQSPFEAAMKMPDAAFQALPAGAYVFLADGTLVRFNRRAADLWGQPPEIRERQEVFCGHRRLFAMSGDLLSWEETPMAEALRKGCPVYGREAIIERPDGSQVAAAFNVEPLRNAAAHIEGGLCCFHEIAQRKEA
jgi:PAS domain S-box-containing protein